MYEATKGQTSALPVLLDRLEYIPVSSDSTRRVHVSGMPQSVSVVQNVHKKIEQQISLYEVMDKVTPVVGFLACMGMAYLLFRMSYGVIW